ncbi:MAG: MraY family glycosyltransferase [Candidatus Doudnabacteria bacterium]|nr:MraY family glycosyltransferase [Candidatus Doudnabacteria bacterium]
MLNFVIFFTIALILSALVTPAIKRLAFKFRILDLPDQTRKLHLYPTPLLGGISVYLSLLISFALYFNFGHPDFNIVPMRFFWGIILGGLVLIMGGAADDKFNLPPKILWLFPALASLIIVWSGIGVGITQISNPFGSPIFIGYSFSLFIIHYSLPAILVWLWMMGMIFTTKLLDGLDGLCGGVGLIGSLTMFALSLTPKVNQPITASIAIIFAGALLGFLIYNFNPASIFLGEGGSTLIGFMLGVLSIILGAKIATALLVMGIPILDVAWAILRRVIYNRSPFKGDRHHLHFRLLDIGLSQRQAVLALYAISAIFGGVAIFLQSYGKLIALVILFALMVIIALTTVILYKKQHPHVPDLFDFAANQGVDEKPKV